MEAHLGIEERRQVKAQEFLINMLEEGNKVHTDESYAAVIKPLWDKMVKEDFDGIETLALCTVILGCMFDSHPCPQHHDPLIMIAITIDQAREAISRIIESAADSN